MSFYEDDDTNSRDREFYETNSQLVESLSSSDELAVPIMVCSASSKDLIPNIRRNIRISDVEEDTILLHKKNVAGIESDGSQSYVKGDEALNSGEVDVMLHHNKNSARSLQLFHSLSSGSMCSTSTMDEDYIEFFDMDSMDSTNSAENGNINLPTNLNSLINGQIIPSSESPTKAFQTKSKETSIETPTTNRTARRCLSLIDTGSSRRQLYLGRKPLALHLHEEAHEEDDLDKMEVESIGEEEPKNSPSLRILLHHHQRQHNGNHLYCFKRPEPPSSITSPIKSKRHRIAEKENKVQTTNMCNKNLYSSTSPSKCVVPARPFLRKCASLNDAEILSALARSESNDGPDLIGDFSKPFILPLVSGRHSDLKSISSDTVAKLLSGEFAESVANYTIIDCRYPYEYEGGHIRGAKNLYTQEQIIAEFPIQHKPEQQLLQSQEGDHKRNIIIFHCEFSSERGPKLSRFLRNTDRVRNTNSYPSLDYPEVYLLHNGYKEFFEKHPELCVPNAYRPMLEPSYNEEYRQFRAKSKSWNGDSVGVASTSIHRLKKSRSRLLL